MRCPRCKSDQRVKDGIVKGRQRYQCKACGFRYTVEYKSGITPYFKRLALMMYIEGLGFRSIGRILGVSNVAVLNWVRDLLIAGKPMKILFHTKIIFKAKQGLVPLKD